MINLQVLEAADGDCMILTYNDNHTEHEIWIDSGRKNTCYKSLSARLKAHKKTGKKIDLLVLTHRDSDHITNAKRLFSRNILSGENLREVWFHFLKEKEYLDPDDGQLSFQQGKMLDEFLTEQRIKRPGKIIARMHLELYDSVFDILGPSEEELDKLWLFDQKEEKKEIRKEEEAKKSKKLSVPGKNTGTIQVLAEGPYDEDDSQTNVASIAFLWTFNSRKILFLGDSISSELVTSITKLGYSEEHPLKVDFCKLPHHGSAHNTSKELVKIIDCENYIISTDETEDRPSKEALSRIIYYAGKPVTFYHNYRIAWDTYFTQDEFEQYQMKFKLIAPEGIDVEK